MEAAEARSKIINFLERNGPSLPVHIAKEIGSDMLFAGAFLSELYQTKHLLISHMRVGNSPLYFLRGQELMLEKFISYLPGKEKESCFLLKKHCVLQDDLQQPSIRVALRSIKDFAIPFKVKNKIFWRYFTLTEIPDGLIRKAEEQEKQGILKEEQKQVEIKKEIEKPKERLVQQEIKPQIALKIKVGAAKEKKKLEAEKFLEEVKEFIAKKDVALAKIEEFDKRQVVASIVINGENCLLIAFNKKRIDEKDLMKAYKRSIHSNLNYFVISKGELSKKTKETVKAYKKLSGFDIMGSH